MYEMLKAKNEWSQERATDFARRLVRTASPSLSESGVADLVAIGYDEVIQDAAGNVVGTFVGRNGGPTVLLNSHMDTVGWEKAGWRHDPLGAEVVADKLFGVGAADCKGGLAAQVYAGDLLKRSLLPLKGNLVVAATVAEENGRSLGVRALLGVTLPDMELKPDYAVLGEPTGLGLYHGHDGWMEVEIRVRGGNPFQVDDATQSISRDLASQAHDRSMGLGWETHEPRYQDTPTGRLAVIRADRRLSPSDSADGVLRQLKHEADLVAAGAGAVAVEVAVCQESQRLYTGKTTVVRQLARQALAAGALEARCGRWHLGRSGMGTAGGVLVQEFNVPTIGFGPGLEEQAHAVDEHVELDKLGRAIYGTALIAHSLIGVPVFGWTCDEI
jgi:acetylornithine deacetylase/succinyl-diaminopimelate desuccinylase-like protein